MMSQTKFSTKQAEKHKYEHSIKREQHIWEAAAITERELTDLTTMKRVAAAQEASSSSAKREQQKRERDNSSTEEDQQH